VSLLFVPSPVPRWTPLLHAVVASQRVLVFASFVQARHPQSGARRFPRRSCHEAAEFASCYGPNRSLALHRQGHLHPSFRPAGSLPPVVGYDYMANNQFPWPNFHRLDTRHYGLQSRVEDEATPR
jgi:hypothetical protein